MQALQHPAPAKVHQHNLTLANTRGIGCNLFKQLIDHFGNAQNVYLASQHDLCQTPGISKRTARYIYDQHTFQEAEGKLAEHQQQNVHIIAYGEKTYPKKLAELPDPPPLLYCSKPLSFRTNPILAIVGSRQMTPYGKDFLEEFIAQIAPYQPTIVSGLAYGTDIHVHKLALEYGLTTIGIIAGGLDHLYPADHEHIAKKMLGSGNIITESPLGIKPEAHLFPIRNRVIAGLCDATLVTEAGVKSGALITASYANQYHREVFALPGPIDAPYTKGPNRLIQSNQAHLITSADDLAYIMNWEKKIFSSDEAKSPDITSIFSTLSDSEHVVVKAVHTTRDPLHFDKIRTITSLDRNTLSSLLFELEMKKHISRMPGDCYTIPRRYLSL